jgi:hypothetical protein
MLRYTRWGLLCALAIMMLVPLSSAFAATKSAAAPTKPATASTNIIGVVDLEQIMTGFNGYRVAMTRIQTFSESRKNYFYGLRDGVGLSEKEWEKYKILIKLSTRTDVENKDIEALKAQAKVVMDEFQKLQQNQQPTDAEKKRMEELTKIIEPSSNFTDGEGRRLSNEVQMEYSKYMKILTDLVEKGIANTAKDKKLAIVLYRDVPTGPQGGQQGGQQGGKAPFVAWGGNDITQVVIGSLNKTFKESMLDVKVDLPQPMQMDFGPNP